VDPRVARTRESALEAATRLLLRDGLDAVTHQKVAAEAGVGRRTLYRHWPDPEALLQDTLAGAAYPVTGRTGELRSDLLIHLEALRQALVHGPLRYVVLALNERAAVRPELRPLRDRLTEGGCRPLVELLTAAVRDGRLPGDLDVDAAVAALEGPLFYRSLVRAETVPAAVVGQVVDDFLARTG
jgi:AcrR family transcriptional regulator